VEISYYICQIVFFVWSCVLVGGFGYSLRVSVDNHGWLYIRTLWLACFTVGSFPQVILFLDPRGLLGIFPIPFLKFIEWTTVIGLIMSFAFTVFMYVDVLHRQNMNKTPPVLARYWLVVNVVFDVLHLLSAAISSGLRTTFFYGVDNFFLCFHELCLVILINAFLWKLERGLLQQTAAMTTVGNGSTFTRALRKIRCMRYGSTVLGVSAMGYQIATSIDRVRRWEPLLDYDNSKFTAQSLIGPLAVLLTFTMFFYISQSTRSQNEEAHSTKGSKGSVPTRSDNTHRSTIVASPSSNNLAAQSNVPTTPSARGSQIV